jgi:phosphoribosylaminoimidazolecarboxamide formyltransferase/IMP cyclohydrolase
MPRALFSVWNKTGIVELGQSLTLVGWDIVATGRTAEILTGAGVSVTPVEQLTGLPEMLGGRVKTLHPAIHAPILARDHSKDMSELTAHGYAPIELVVCNLYPFQQTIAQASVTIAQAVEQIDIGGVTLIRAAAKNFERVIVVVNPADYEAVQVALVEDGQVSASERRNLALKAFAHTRDYDTAIHSYLMGDNLLDESANTLGDHFTIGLTQTQSLRYGENPHQQAGLYATHADLGPLGGTLLQGKPLSYNNLLDASAAYQAVSAFGTDDKAAVVIIKHMNPTGIAVADTIAEAMPEALASDPVSAFGGIIAVNRQVDAEFVRALGGLFVEVLIAPTFTDEACELLMQGRKNCRLIAVNETQVQKTLEFRSIQGGVLVQELDIGDPDTTEWQVVTRRSPTPEEVDALKFAWKAAQYVRSNAIVLAGQTATFGIGGGLPSRVDAAKLAVEKAGERAQGAVLASDAFFPFADGLQIAIDVGVTAVIQPGGSIRDQEVIDASDEADLAMIFTKVRHFRH